MALNIKLSPEWFGAIASVAGAGVLLVPKHRVLAGVVGGAAVLAIALYQTSQTSQTPCDGCADKKEPPTVRVGEPSPTTPLGIPPPPTTTTTTTTTTTKPTETSEDNPHTIDQMFARAKRKAS